MANNHHQVIRIDVLPDDDLLGIFDFYSGASPWHEGKRRIEAWQTLAHVCRRWRSLVLGSPRRLNLRLYCRLGRRSRHMLDTWPILPLIVTGNMDSSSVTDNDIAILEQSNRICGAILQGFVGGKMEKVLAAMEVPFPELTDLLLTSPFFAPVIPIPDSFLGGSAPSLRSFTLNNIPFPGLPNLLLSATHLVCLKLLRIPHSGYISPEAMMAPLSVLTSLETLILDFTSPPDLEIQSLPPIKRFILPALHEFRFSGVSQYLEVLVTHIDAPQLKSLCIFFYNQINFDCPRFTQFINSTPTLRVPDEVRVEFLASAITAKLRYRTSEFGAHNLEIGLREGLHRQLSSIVQICNSSLHPLFMVEDLYIGCQISRIWENLNDTVEITLWLRLLRPFTAVKNLYLSKEFAQRISAPLGELVGSRLLEVLPSLQNIFVKGFERSGPFQEDIGQFVAARQLSGHPIAISDWDGMMEYI